MEQLSASLDRLQAALIGLESAVESRIQQGESLREEAVGALEQLQAERDNLAAELEAVRADAAALEEVTDDVAGRLDGAIEGIKEVLGN